MSVTSTGTVVRLPPRSRLELDGRADARLLELLGQFREAPHRLAVDGDDDVAELAGPRIDAAQAGALGRRAGQRSG